MPPYTFPFRPGDRVQIPVHYETWMRGARYGTVHSLKQAALGRSAAIMVKMDHPGIKKLVPVWKLDWEYMRGT